MKKTNAFILSFPLLLLFSCTASLFPDLHSDLKDLDAAPYSTHIPIEKARQTVQDALDAMALQTKAGVGRTITEGYLMDRSRMTKAAAEAPGDTIPPYYVFNFADDQGYALASVDSRMSPILCIIDQGHFSPDSALTNPGQIALLSRIETDYRMALGLPIEGPDGELMEAEQYATDLNIPLTLMEYEGTDPGGLDNGHTGEGGYQWIEYDPVATYYGTGLSTCWDQWAPFYNYMPIIDNTRCPAGCVTIAVAQLMNYHGKDVTLDSYFVDWDIINTIGQYGNEGSLSALEMIANFVYKAAVAMDANITPTKTGIYGWKVPGFLSSLGYTSGGTQVDYDDEALKTELANDFPVLGEGYALRIPIQILGITVNYNYDEGHEWVYDKYLTLTTKTEKLLGSRVLETMYSYEHLVHCNLGWGGWKNGYYYFGSYNTNLGPAYPSNGFVSFNNNGNVTKSEPTDNGVPDHYQFLLKMTTGIRP